MKAPAKRGRSYSTANTTYLLDLIESSEPCGADEWNSVAFRYNAQFNGESRSGDDLKNKFKSLKNVKKPTGSTSFLAATDCQVHDHNSYEIYQQAILPVLLRLLEPSVCKRLWNLGWTSKLLERMTTMMTSMLEIFPQPAMESLLFLDIMMRTTSIFRTMSTSILTRSQIMNMMRKVTKKIFKYRTITQALLYLTLIRTPSSIPT